MADVPGLGRIIGKSRNHLSEKRRALREEASRRIPEAGRKERLFCERERDRSV